MGETQLASKRERKKERKLLTMVSTNSQPKFYNEPFPKESAVTNYKKASSLAVC